MNFQSNKPLGFFGSRSVDSLHLGTPNFYGTAHPLRALFGLGQTPATPTVTPPPPTPALTPPVTIPPPTPPAAPPAGGVTLITPTGITSFSQLGEQAAMEVLRKHFNAVYSRTRVTVPYNQWQRMIDEAWAMARYMGTAAAYSELDRRWNREGIGTYFQERNFYPAAAPATPAVTPTPATPVYTPYTPTVTPTPAPTPAITVVGTADVESIVDEILEWANLPMSQPEETSIQAVTYDRMVTGGAERILCVEYGLPVKTTYSEAVWRAMEVEKTIPPAALAEAQARIRSELTRRGYSRYTGAGPTARPSAEAIATPGEPYEWKRLELRDVATWYGLTQAGIPAGIVFGAGGYYSLQSVSQVAPGEEVRLTTQELNQVVQSAISYVNAARLPTGALPRQNKEDVLMFLNPDTVKEQLSGLGYKFWVAPTVPNWGMEAQRQTIAALKAQNLTFWADILAEGVFWQSKPTNIGPERYRALVDAAASRTIQFYDSAWPEYERKANEYMAATGERLDVVKASEADIIAVIERMLANVQVSGGAPEIPPTPRILTIVTPGISREPGWPGVWYGDAQGLANLALDVVLYRAGLAKMTAPDVYYLTSAQDTEIRNAARSLIIHVTGDDAVKNQAVNLLEDVLRDRGYWLTPAAITPAVTPALREDTASGLAYTALSIALFNRGYGARSPELDYSITFEDMDEIFREAIAIAEASGAMTQVKRTARNILTQDRMMQLRDRGYLVQKHREVVTPVVTPTPPRVVVRPTPAITPYIPPVTPTPPALTPYITPEVTPEVTPAAREYTSHDLLTRDALGWALQEYGLPAEARVQQELTIDEALDVVDLALDYVDEALAAWFVKDAARSLLRATVRTPAGEFPAYRYFAARGYVPPRVVTVTPTPGITPYVTPYVTPTPAVTPEITPEVTPYITPVRLTARDMLVEAVVLALEAEGLPESVSPWQPYYVEDDVFDGLIDAALGIARELSAEARYRGFVISEENVREELRRRNYLPASAAPLRLDEWARDAPVFRTWEECRLAAMQQVGEAPDRWQHCLAEVDMVESAVSHALNAEGLPMRGAAEVTPGKYQRIVDEALLIAEAMKEQRSYTPMIRGRQIAFTV